MKRFDRILWRINGVLLLFAVAAGIILLIWGLAQTFFYSANEHKDAAVVDINQGTHQREYLNLGSSTKMTGLSVVRMPLNSDTSYRSFSSESSGGRTRNFLFIDFSSMSSKWLFDGFQRLILNEHDLYASLNNSGTNVVGSIYEVVASDTNGDGKVTEDDQVAAFWGTPDGKDVIEVVSSAKRILSVEQVTDTEVLIIYQQEKSTVALLLSTSTGKKIREGQLPMQQTADK
jgi:hypothetical protein